MKKFVVETKDVLFKGKKPVVTIGSGLTVLVGPNGVGKTQVLSGLRASIEGILLAENHIVRYLSAGRASPFEHFRSSVNGPHGREDSPAYVGQTHYSEQWHRYESLTGDYLELYRRADLRMKVQVRMQSFLSRSMNLTWGQHGLEVRLVPVGGGDLYTANDEASGILQLAPLLAAIYNDEVGALLIDEPEISLHPQYQSFIMQELQAVAGDPLTQPGKKIVIVATHSPSVLPLRSVADLPAIVFFNDKDTLPIQVASDSPELENKKLAALVARLTTNHRLAFFAKNVLLVEGGSDEIIVNQLARVLKHPVLPANTQVVPVIGKSEFHEAIRLFELIGKRVFVLADLDALSDGNALVNVFSSKPGSDDVALTFGHSTIVDLDRTIRSDFAKVVNNCWHLIESLVVTHHYWLDRSTTENSDNVKRRSVLAVLMSEGSDEFDRLVGSNEFSALRQRFVVLFNALESVGCFVLRKGAIEDYYGLSAAISSKLGMAADEAASFDESAPEMLEAKYADVLRAIRAAAPIRPVDENALLRERLGAAVGATFQFIKFDTPSAELNGRVRGSQPDLDIFELENCSTESDLRIRVNMKSPLFIRDTLPFEISISENATQVIKSKLPSS